VRWGYSLFVSVVPVRSKMPSRYSFIAWSIAILIFSLLVLPQQNYPLFGDDYLLLRASGMHQGFGSSVELAFGQTGLEKYRPGFLIPYATLHQMLGENLSAYLIVNSVLTFALGLAFGLVLKEATRLESFAIPAGIVLISSMRFLWSSREWIYGLMEIIALFSCLLAIYFYLQIIRKLECSYCTLLANSFFLISIFTAERYIYVGIIFTIYFAFLRRRYGVAISDARIVAPAMIVLFNFALKIFVLRVNPLQGSLVDYQDMESQNLFSNMIDVVLLNTARVLGFSMYPSENTYGAILRLILCLILGYLFSTVFVCYVSRIFLHKQLDYGILSKQNPSNFLFFGIGITGIFAISLEPYRLWEWDERFLVLTQLMVFILAINLSPRILSPSTRFNPYLVVIILLAMVEWSYLPERDYRFSILNRVMGMNQVLDPYLNGSQPWRLVLDIPPPIQSDVSWALGYPNDHFLGIFEASNNPPLSINGISQDELTCVIAKFDEDSLDTTLASC